MSFLKGLLNKAKGIDPFFEDVKTEQIDLYQHYFKKVIQSVDVSTQTGWSMGKSYDREQFLRDQDLMEQIICGEAGPEGLSPAILQVIVNQYFFADVYQREMDREQWTKRVIYRKNPDYFPSGWGVRKILDEVS
ncbi:MAG: hypothetical protein HGA87_07110 [Desulfobulbaceae bacterium]|nr:hypothetical protein [Desulfobulbaceae bacterium]